MARPREMTVDEIVAVMERADDPFLTAKEISEMVDASKGTVHDRLTELEESGRIERKKVGGRAVVWWLPAREPPKNYEMSS